MEGMSEREYSAHSGLSRGAIQKARKASRLVVYSDGSINAAASDVRRAEMTDPDQQRRSTGGDSGFCGPADSSSYLKARTALTVYQAQDKQLAHPEEEGHAGRPGPGGSAGVPVGPTGTRYLGHLAQQSGSADGGRSGLGRWKNKPATPVIIEAAILQRVLEAHVRAAPRRPRRSPGLPRIAMTDRQTT